MELQHSAATSASAPPVLGIALDCKRWKKKKAGRTSILPALVIPRLLELEADAQLNAPWISCQCSDPHEVHVRETGDGVPPLRVVQDVGRLDSELGAVPAERERAEEARVQVPVERPSELVASGVAPLGSRFGE